MRSHLRLGLLAFAWLSVLTGIVYPLVVTAIAHVLFAGRASGSLLRRDGVVVGSELLGQPFRSPGYFWGRPSATSPFPFNASASGASNLGPTNPALVDAVTGRVHALREADPTNDAPAPVDLVTTSGSGLDPDVSPAAAYYQVGRVARARAIPLERVRQLVDDAVVAPTFGLLGEARVNVVRLNLALDAMR